MQLDPVLDYIQELAKECLEEPAEAPLDLYVTCGDETFECHVTCTK